MKGLSADADGSHYRNRHPDRGLNVPYNLDPDVLEEFARINQAPTTLYPVKQIYFAKPFSLTGSGRPAGALPQLRTPLSEICRAAHSHNIEVAIVMNAPSMGGLEWSPQFHTDLESVLHELGDAGVDGTIVTMPSLAYWIREIMPELWITLSVNAHISSVQRLEQAMRHWPADRFYLDPALSRSLQRIRAMSTSHPKVHLVALVNESCLSDCILQPFHQDYLAQTSRQATQLAAPDLCHVLCALEKLSDDRNVLRSPWVPPQGCRHLFDAGVSRIKLAGRTLDSERLVRLVRAYASGHVEGDIWPFFEKSGLTSPEWEAILGKKMQPCRHRVDSEKLTGFIDYFAQTTPPCTKGLGCHGCTHCDKYMDAVTPPANKAERIEDMRKLLNLIQAHKWEGCNDLTCTC